MDSTDSNVDNAAVVLSELTMEDLDYVDYTDESMLPEIQKLIAADLSEPYSIFTYRYFLHQWPNLCICVFVKDKVTGLKGNMIATIVCKAEHVRDAYQGYIAMLTVDKQYRKLGIGRKLSMLAINRMVALGCDEIMLETEASNAGALVLYEKLGFLREDKMSKYYLNGGDAYRLKFWISRPEIEEDEELRKAEAEAAGSK